MVISNDNLTTAQKETCAVISMRDAAALMARDKQISYEDALLLFAGSRIYESRFFPQGCLLFIARRTH